MGRTRPSYPRELAERVSREGGELTVQEHTVLLNAVKRGDLTAFEQIWLNHLHTHIQ